MIATPDNNRQKILRLFYALLPDKKTQRELQQWQTHVSGKKTPVENLHLTLFFLGNQPDKHLPAFKRFMDRTLFEAFEIRLDTIGYFPKIGLSWAGPSDTPCSLENLFQQIRRFLVPAYIKDRNENFRPHVTLARQSAKPETLIASPIEWNANRFALMESILSNESGKHPQYRILYEKAG